MLRGHKPTIELYEAGKEVRRSSGYTPIENTDTPFVFAVFKTKLSWPFGVVRQAGKTDLAFSKEIGPGHP